METSSHSSWMVILTRSFFGVFVCNLWFLLMVWVNIVSCRVTLLSVKYFFLVKIHSSIHIINSLLAANCMTCRTVARKFTTGGLCVCAGGLDIQKLTKAALSHTLSCFKLERLGALFGGAKPTKATPWRRDCMHFLSPMFLFVISGFYLLFGWMLFLAESLSSLWNIFSW